MSWQIFVIIFAGIVGLIISYQLIKAAVKSAILEAFAEINNARKEN